MTALEERWLDAETVASTRPTATAPHNHFAGHLHRITVLGRLLLRSLVTLLTGCLSREQWRGTEPRSGASLQAIYYGCGENRAHLYRQLYDEDAPAQPRPRHWLLQLGQWRHLPSETDLLLLDLPFPLSRLLGRRAGIAVPAWLKQKVAIADSWEAVLAGLRRKTRREVLRLIAKHQLRARVVPATQVARHFYRTLYRPYIEQRYQQGAALVSERRFVRESRHGEVIELLQGDRLLGSALLRRHGGELAVVWTGLANTSGADAPQGVTDALDFFSLLHGYQSGCKVLNLGGSRADLQDGLLRYKRKWGARIEVGRVPQTLLRIAPLRDTTAVRGFLQRHSFVASMHGELVGKLWLDTAIDAEALRELSDRLWSEGLTRCELLLDSGAMPMPSVPPELTIYPVKVWRAFWNIETSADNRLPTMESR